MSPGAWTGNDMAGSLHHRSVWSPRGLQAGDPHTPRDIYNEEFQGAAIPIHAKVVELGTHLSCVPDLSLDLHNKQRMSGSPLRGQPGSQLLQPKAGRR